jgi:hypothetical protein
MNVDDQALNEVMGSVWDLAYRETDQQVSDTTSKRVSSQVMTPVWDTVWGEVYIRVWTDMEWSQLDEHQ